MSSAPPTPWLARHTWAIPLVLLTVVGTGTALVLTRPAWLFGAVASSVVGAGLLWIVVSVFWPARADRTCSACSADALERSDPESSRGLVCRACGHADPDASSWFLAEEEGPLEDIVLRERRRRRESRTALPLASSAKHTESPGP